MLKLNNSQKNTAIDKECNGNLLHQESGVKSTKNVQNVENVQNIKNIQNIKKIIIKI